MSDTKLIDALAAAVLRGVSDEMLISEYKVRGIPTAQTLTRETLKRRVEDLSADDLAYVLEHVDGAKLVYALDRETLVATLGEEMLKEYAKDWAVSNAEEFLECVEVDELLEELRNRCRQ